jgi:hypothetical protein
MIARSLAAVVLFWVTAVAAQDADLTILVDDRLLEHGGVVELWVYPDAEILAGSRTVILTERFTRILLAYPEGGTYRFRFRPVPETMERDGMDRFVTELLRYGGRGQYDGDEWKEYDFQAIRVFPFQEYGSESEAERINAAWGVVERYADPPPANHWGARALMGVFDASGEKRVPRLVCTEDGGLEICQSDPEDALLKEALWWREIAEGRLERLRHDALQGCYDGGGPLSRPTSCAGEAGRGWPSFRPAE